MAFSPGMQIGKYELRKKLGEGGFGLVFMAQDTNLDREVALKFMHPEHTANAEILRRFLQEARSAAKIVHPGIVTVFECGQVSGTGTQADGVAYIAMELLHGESLTDRLQRMKRLSPEVASEITWQVASALEAAHKAGIIHRDLKPDNIFICRDPAMPSGERVKVLDFGIAKLAQSAGTNNATRSQMVMGTPPYMSPEQCRSAAHIDHRSDIYTLGCILFELVCGQPPFDGEAGELIAKHQMVPPPNARMLVPSLPPKLDQLIAQMLAKQPGDRPQSMTAVQEALGPAGTGSDARRTPARGVPAVHEHATIMAGTRTTLGGAVGQVGAAASQPGYVPARSSTRLRPLVLGVGALAIIAVIIGVVIATNGSGEKKDVAAAASPSPTAEPAPAAQPTPPPPAATPPAPAPTTPPAAPTKIKFELDSTPVAEVWSYDGRLLGKTPYKSERAPAEGQLVFVLKAKGYEEQRVELPADQNTIKQVELVAVKTVAKQPKPSTPKTGSATTKTKPGDAKPLKPGDIVID